MMKKYQKYYLFILPIIFLSILSLLNLYYAPNLSSLYENLFNKQIIWYIISFVLSLLILFIKPHFIINNSHYIYWINVILLFLVLFLGDEVNGSKAWFNFGFISFQPSEFMKLSLILYLTKIMNNDSKDLNLLFKIIILFLIPSILTFLEPDTGAVIIYFIISFSLILFSNINKKYILYLLGIGLLFTFIILILYKYQSNLFFQIFGSSIYYRIERLTNFKSGMQIENALTTIANAKLINLPKDAINLYFPEAATDFIFALSINNFGLLSGIIILLCYFLLDIQIIKFIFHNKNQRIKLITVGFFSMFLYQQIQNIFMNIGILPIIGIPLPFLSYGGSSLILFFISFTFIFKLKIDNEKYPYRVFYN